MACSSRADQLGEEEEEDDDDEISMLNPMVGKACSAMGCSSPVERDDEEEDGDVGSRKLTPMEKAFIEKASEINARGDDQRYNFLQFYVETLMAKENIDLEQWEIIERNLLQRNKMSRERFEEEEIKEELNLPHLDKLEITPQEEKTMVMENMEKTKKKNNEKGKRVMRNSKEDKSPPPPEPSEKPLKMLETIQQLGGTNLVWLVEKVLTDSDVSAQQHRFLFPPCNTLDEFVTVDERDMAEVGNKYHDQQLEEGEIATHHNGLTVKVVDATGREWLVDLRRWTSTGGKYVFTNGWNSIVEGLRLRDKNEETPGLRNTIQLWCFRQLEGSKLCFAINISRS